MTSRSLTQRRVSSEAFRNITSFVELDLIQSLPTANEVCEGYIFTRNCLSTEGVGGGVWYTSMSYRRYPSMPCRSPGWVSRPTLKEELDRSGREWVSKPTPREVSRPTPRGVPSQHPGGISRPTSGGRCIPACTEADPPQLTATVAGGTHSTGTHSCFDMNSKHHVNLYFN